MRGIITFTLILLAVYVKTGHTRSIKPSRSQRLSEKAVNSEPASALLSRRRRHADGTLTDRFGKLLGRQSAIGVVNLIKGKDSSSNSPLTRCITRRLRHKLKVSNRFYKKVMISCVRQIFK